MGILKTLSSRLGKLQEPQVHTLICGESLDNCVREQYVYPILMVCTAQQVHDKCNIIIIIIIMVINTCRITPKSWNKASKMRKSS